MPKRKGAPSILQGPSLKAGLALGLSAGAYDGRAGQPMPPAAAGTSIFDPVLCELVYRWFSPPAGLVLDPFAGGSVRGIVAAHLGRRYVGVDLSRPQIEANRAQWREIGGPKGRKGAAPEWHCGDAREIDRWCGAGTADLLFSCPPYVDLERYSDDPADLSTLAWPEFRAAHRAIIAKAAACLADDRFAVWVVGDVRGPDGADCGLVPETIAAFQAAGLAFYNDAILVTAIGSLSLRTPRQFEKSRKLGKTHQNVLGFVKGDPVRATKAVGKIDTWRPDDDA